MLLAILWSLIGCGGGEAPPPEPANAPAPVPEPEPEPTLDPAAYGWVSEAALQPSAFEALVSSHREPWIAMHGHRYEDAIVGFEDQPKNKARAQMALGLFHEDLARLTGVTMDAFLGEWEARVELPKESSLYAIAAMASACNVDVNYAAWGNRAKPGTEGFQFAQQVARGVPPLDYTGSDSFGRRMTLHRNVAKEGGALALISAASEPLVTETGDGFERVFYDPCVHDTVSRHFVPASMVSVGAEAADYRAMGAWAGNGLAGRLFSTWLTPVDLSAALNVPPDDIRPGTVGMRLPSLRKLGVKGMSGAGDSVDAARADVRTVDKALDAWEGEIREAASDEGKALLDDLGLMKRFRQEWLVVRARGALLNNRPQQALAMLELGRDVAADEVGPTNSPHLYALQAEALVRLGRAREALDALAPLWRARPEITGIKEVLDDLAVLDSLGTEGDSKED